MTVLIYSVVGGDELDRVTLTDTGVTYQTGRAYALIESRRDRGRTLEQIVAEFSDWSNGYVRIREQAG